jgi:acyl-CoA synthetase (NDP forming)
MRKSARSNGELLNPKSVAVIGATEDQTKFGGRLYRMLLKHHYAGVVYPINPRRAELFGLKAYPALGDTPAIPDMIVMAVPRPSVIENITEAARLGVKCAIIITSKFSDEGKEGARIEADLVATARRGGMRLIGPNCLGVISPANRLVLCSSPALEADTLPQEPIGFVSQSGALMATVFDRARDRGIGFSHCVSVGNQADLELCDFLEYFIEDTRTGIVCAYVEGIKDPARFLVLADRAREVGKPILMVKAGRTAMGARAAYSHTASLAGSFAALEAVCRDRGVVLMDDLDAMVLLASSLGRYPGRAVRSACLITTSGGGGAIASDRLAERGVPLTEFAPATQAALTRWYSPGQASNPIDLGGRLPGGEAVDVADTTMTIAADDPAHDVLMPLITTAPMLANTVGKMADAAAARGKPCLFIMAPGHAADGARQALVERRIPFADSLDEAVRTVHAWHTMPDAGARPTVTRPVGLPETPPSVTGQLDPIAVEGLLSAYGMPLVPQKICRDHASALHSGQVAGYAGYDSPNAVIAALLKEPMREIASPLNDLNGMSGIVVRRDSVEKQPELVAGLCRAFYESLVFAQANPRATVLNHWRLYPDQKPSNVPEAQALTDAIAMLNNRLVGIARPGPEGLFGSIPLAEMQETADELLAAGMLQTRADMAKLSDLRFKERCGRLDVAALTTEAKAWQPPQ